MEENLIETITGLTRSLSIPVTRTAIIKEISIQPYKNTLFGLSEVLSKWQITNAAYQLPADELSQDYTPFIAYINKGIKEYGFVLVKEINQDTVTVHNEHWNNKQISRHQFEQLYNGAVLLVEPEPDAGEKNYRQSRRNELWRNLRLPFLCLTAMLVFLNYFLAAQQSTQRSLLLLLLPLTGLALSALLTAQHLGVNGPLAAKLCFGGKNTACDSITASPQSRLFSWLSWAEIGALYFFACLFLTLYAFHLPGIRQTMAWLSAASLFYAVYSVGYQAFIAKKWCVLCCAVQAILAVHFIVLLPYLDNGAGSLNGAGIAGLLLAFFLPAALWIMVKPLYLRSNELASAKKTLQKFKQNDELFKNVLAAQPAFDQPDSSISIVLGNRASKNIITIVSNPFCGPCADSHKSLEEWLQVSDDLQVRVILTSNEQSNAATRHMVALHNNADARLVSQALHDWYKQSKKDYATWAKKYPVEQHAAATEQMLAGQDQWCDNVGVSYTPMVLVNGHQLPENYAIADLKYLL